MKYNSRKCIAALLSILVIITSFPAIALASGTAGNEANSGNALDKFYEHFADKKVNSAYFTAGSDKDCVRAVMGEPDIAADMPDYNYWRYKSSYVYFNASNKVSSWLNKGNLKVSLGDMDYLYKGFAPGAGFEDVVKAMGTPDEIKYDSAVNQLTWMYGTNSVFFDATGTVKGWMGDAKIKVFMGNRVQDAPAIMIGSSKDDVLKAMGTPTTLYASEVSDFWGFGISTIYFDDQGKVATWSNIGRNLKVTMGTSDPVAGIFGIGSSKADVLKIMGTPDYMFEAMYSSYWRYGNSRIEFDRNGIVKAWHNNDFNLKVNLGVKIVDDSPITFGFTKSDVVKVMGTPWAIITNGSSESWSYGLSVITFKDGSVISWYNVGNNLKVGLPKEKDPLAPPFTLGSTKQAVALVMGPPDSGTDTKENSTWNYDGSSVYFGSDQKVNAWANNDGKLKLKLGPDQLNNGTFTLGSDSKTVLDCMGAPKVISDNGTETFWKYGISTIYFDEFGKVTAWSNLEYNLKVTLGQKNESAAPFTLGSGKDAVIKAMGTPQVIGIYGDMTSWSYGTSTIYFDKIGKVSAWNNNGELKVSMGIKDPQAKPFTVGSSAEDVVKAMGTPTSISTNIFSTCYWRYGWSSTVYFDRNGKVSFWSNTDKNLKVVE